MILQETPDEFLVALMKETYPTPIRVQKKDFEEFTKYYMSHCEGRDEEFFEKNPIAPAYHDRCLARVKREAETS